jgi:6-pyruvoyltetrahydropterin/6-carboxytetrahydropterin synthase
MRKVRVTKEFHFEMAHALKNYNGLCKNIHGHSYKMFVTVIGTPRNNPLDSKDGMLIDFGDLKRLINKEITDVYDHAFVVNVSNKEGIPDASNEMFGKLMFVDYQPTCENMVIDFANKIKKILPDNVNLFSLKLHETATSYAEWFASDNLNEL